MAYFRTGGGSEHQMDSGTQTLSTSDMKITLGYKPTYIDLLVRKSDTVFVQITYSNSIYSDKQVLVVKSSSTSTQINNVPNTSKNRIKSIDDDGFTLSGWDSSSISTFGSTAKWVAGK